MMDFMGVFSRPKGPMRLPSREAYAVWLRNFSLSESHALHIQIFGKPIVRVAVDRQVPNEADL